MVITKSTNGKVQWNHRTKNEQVDDKKNKFKYYAAISNSLFFIKVY